MGEIIFDWILMSLIDGLGNAISDGIDYLIRQVTDGAGRVFTEFVQQIDTDGDGVYDQEIVLHSLDLLIPDLDNGYCCSLPRKTRNFDTQNTKNRESFKAARGFFLSLKMALQSRFVVIPNIVFNTKVMFVECF